jgi:hypothetical protein
MMSIREKMRKNIFPNHAYEFITGALNKKIAIGLFSSHRAAVGKFVQRIILIRSRSPIKKQSDYRLTCTILHIVNVIIKSLQQNYTIPSLVVSKS